jgi:hypothetical protein
MIHFKNRLRKGFSFIEAIIALAIIAGAVSTFLLLQQKVFYRVALNTFKIQRLPLLKNMLLVPKITMAEKGVGQDSSGQQNQQEDVKKIEKSFSDPEAKVLYERLPISADSILGRFEGLYQERITAQWVEAEHKRMVDLYHYGFQMEEKKNETR